MALRLQVDVESPNLKALLKLFRYDDASLVLDQEMVYFLVIRSSNTLPLHDPLHLVKEYTKHYKGYHVVSKDGSLEFGMCHGTHCTPKGWITDTEQKLFGYIASSEDYSRWSWVIPSTLENSTKMAVCSLADGSSTSAMCEMRYMVPHNTTYAPSMLVFSGSVKGLYNIAGRSMYSALFKPV